MIWENGGLKMVLLEEELLIGDYVEHRRMWSNIAWGWITVEVYKNKQLIHQFEFDNEVKKSISERQKFNDYADNQVKEFRRKHYGE